MATGSVIKRGTSYAIKYRDAGGRQRFKTIGKNKREADRELIEVMATINRTGLSEPERIGFADFAECWTRDFVVTLRSSTQTVYAGYLKNHLIPYFGNQPLLTITRRQCQGLVAELQGPKNFGAKSISNIMATLKLMFRHAIRWEYLQVNPSFDVHKPRIEPNEKEFYTPEEARALLEEIEEPYRILYLTALSTGMRQGELLGLTRSNIDLDRSLIMVRQQLSRERVLGTPKTKSSIRNIGVGPMLLDALKLHLETVPMSDLDLVFCGKTGAPHDPSNLDRRIFTPAAERAGIKKIKFHELRHTYACWMASRGENIKFIQRVMGHARIATTLDTYGHLLPDTGAECAARHEAQLLGQ